MRLPFDALADQAFLARTLISAGIVAPGRPDRVARAVMALGKWGKTHAAGYAAGAARTPDRLAIVDERGTLTFSEVDRRTTRIANALRARGVSAGAPVALMCRNHRGFVEGTVALNKVGADVLYLNTSFAAPQIADVVKREGASALVYDAEFSELVGPAAKRRKRFISWHEPEEKPSDPTLEQLVAEGDPEEPGAPAEASRTVILTSGTTGTPKGANRGSPDSLAPAAALLDRIPLRARETTMIAAPLFHSWGFAHWTLATALGSTIVLRHRFDPEETLAAVAEHRASALAVVPVMLQRIMDLPAERRAAYDVSSLRVIAASGSALPGPLALRVMDAFGEVLYNLYGSTEVAWATIAGPEDLRAAPGTAGRPPRGTVMRLLDPDGREVPRGETGRIFVANEMQFEGYTGGGNKEIVDGLMSTGDVGHLDAAGRLFVDGRDDDMIVSGGENVFPAEVEDLLHEHEAIREAAVVGVPDEEFGQRLKAFVVVREDADLDADEVRAHVKANLARFKVPRDVEFVDELPRTATGKVLRRALG